MNINEYPEIVHNAWAMHESYRRLGFSPDVIFFEVVREASPGTPLCLFASLRTQGRDFKVNVGQLGSIEPERLMDMWTQFSRGLLGFAESDLDVVYDASMARLGGRAGLVVAMMDKGFRFPRGVN